MRLSLVKNPKIFVPVICLLLVSGLIIVIVHNMSQPAVGDISQAPQSDALKPDPYARPGSFNGKYISFNYPSHYQKVPSKLSGSNLEVAQYHSTDSTGKLINIAVYKGDIASESGVTYRRQHKELYTESSSQKWLEFTKKDGTEDTFFITHKNLLATVSATAPYNSQSGEALFITSSLKWR